MHFLILVVHLYSIFSVERNYKWNGIIRSTSCSIWKKKEKKIVKRKLPIKPSFKLSIKLRGCNCIFTKNSPRVENTQCGNEHNFSVTHILREIIIDECRVSKPAILSHLEALNFDFYAFLHFYKA